MGPGQEKGAVRVDARHLVMEGERGPADCGTLLDLLTVFDACVSRLPKWD